MRMFQNALLYMIIGSMLVIGCQTLMHPNDTIEVKPDTKAMVILINEYFEIRERIQEREDEMSEREFQQNIERMERIQSMIESMR